MPKEWMTPERRLSRPICPCLNSRPVILRNCSNSCEMEDDNIFPHIAKAEDLFIEASAAIDTEAQKIAGQGLMVKVVLDAEENESDDEIQVPIPTSKAVMEAVNTIQLYAMTHGDEQSCPPRST